jgi:polar amino acid transport system ATP-binding protein/general L-amino acid transport system ATP-binding protein
MNEGRILERGKPDNFFDHPKSERAKLFLEQIIH